MPICKTCGKECSDYEELAQHILSNKKTHKSGRRWAAKYKLINSLSAKNRREHRERVPLTEDDKEKKLSAVREVSGIEKGADAYCPSCKRTYRVTVPIEYIESQSAWTTGTGKLLILCQRCGDRHNKSVDIEREDCYVAEI